MEKEINVIKEIVGDAYSRGYFDGLEMCVKYGVEKVVSISKEVIHEAVEKMKKGK